MGYTAFNMIVVSELVVSSGLAIQSSHEAVILLKTIVVKKKPRRILDRSFTDRRERERRQRGEKEIQKQQQKLYIGKFNNLQINNKKKKKPSSTVCSLIHTVNTNGNGGIWNLQVYPQNWQTSCLSYERQEIIVSTMTHIPASVLFKCTIK